MERTALLAELGGQVSKMTGILNPAAKGKKEEKKVRSLIGLFKRFKKCGVITCLCGVMTFVCFLVFRKDYQ